jgi:hypothetical protein
MKLVGIIFGKIAKNYQIFTELGVIGAIKLILNSPNKSFERDVCYAAAPHTPLKLGVNQDISNKADIINDH